MTYLGEIAERARKASTVLASVRGDVKNAALKAMSEQLLVHQRYIMERNRVDIERAEASGTSASMIDRLRLTDSRIGEMASGLAQIARLEDPVGEVMSERTLANGLLVQQVRVPFGVIGMIYEARPNVTVDASALAMKAGSASVLRGGSDAIESNRALVMALQAALSSVGIPADAIQLIERTERDMVNQLLTMKGKIDLIIPRGGPSLIKLVVENATVPVIETGVGNCHLYVDAEADLNMALSILLNGKTQRPSVCNALETLLVHRNVAEQFLPVASEALYAAGVELRGCERSRQIVPQIIPVSEEDYATEFVAPILAVKVVDSLDEVLSHIAQYGTNHSEAIVTNNHVTAERFLQSVDACAVYHNASTRFTDGQQMGFGAEIGISTQKLHARGPMGLREITTYKYIVRGRGQVRS